MLGLAAGIIILCLIVLSIILIGAKCVSRAAVTVESMVNKRRRVIVMYYINNCPHCKLMMAALNEVKKDTTARGIVFKEILVDMTKPCTDAEYNVLGLTPCSVESYPAIFMIEHGRSSEYKGPADVAMLLRWCTRPLGRG